MTPAEILDLPMESNDANAGTVREYLRALLLAAWEEGEGFSGKRPFGNSGWERELYLPLVKAGAVVGKLDGDGYIDEVDKKHAHALIVEAIKSLCSKEAK